MCRVTGDHYFAAQPNAPAQTREVQFTVAGRDYTLASAAGVFSATRLDPGTAVLLRKADLPDAAQPAICSISAAGSARSPACSPRSR